MAHRTREIRSPQNLVIMTAAQSYSWMLAGYSAVNQARLATTTGAQVLYSNSINAEDEEVQGDVTQKTWILPCNKYVWYPIHRLSQSTMVGCHEETRVQCPQHAERCSRSGRPAVEAAMSNAAYFMRGRS